MYDRYVFSASSLAEGGFTLLAFSGKNIITQVLYTRRRGSIGLNLKFDVGGAAQYPMQPAFVRGLLLESLVAVGRISQIIIKGVEANANGL